MELSTIKTTLDTIGYYSIQSEIPFEKFKELSLGLGRITAINAIRCKKDFSKGERIFYINSDMAAPFHTDGLYTDYVAWYCIDPGHENEETLLLDVRSILNQFSDTEKSCLKKVMFYNLNAGSFPILRSENPLDFYFVPSQISKSKKHGKNLELLKKVHDVIEKTSQNNIIRIKYKRKRCLFLNNKTFLHGRSKLNAQTTRHLKRLWIQKP